MHPSPQRDNDSRSVMSIDTDDLAEHKPPAYKLIMEEAEATSSVLAVALHTSFTPRDAVVAMQLWNKILAFRSAFAEAIALQWRVELCYDSDGAQFGTLVNPDRTAIYQVERNIDPLAVALGAAVHDLPDLATGLLDAAIRAANPATQTVQREAYRADADLVKVARADGTALPFDNASVPDFCELLAASAPPPRMAVGLVRAAVWAATTHAPYAQSEDHEDLAEGLESALARVIAQTAAEPLLTAIRARAERMQLPSFCKHLPDVWGAFSDADRAAFAETFYRRLLSKYPDMLEYFAGSDMDALSVHLADALHAIVRAPRRNGMDEKFRAVLQRLGNVHRHYGIPTYAYPLLGTELVAAFAPHFEAAAAAAADPGRLTVDSLRSSLVALYADVVSIMHYPMRRQERLLADAHDFFQKVAVELGWSERRLEERLLRVEMEVCASGTYAHTSEELEVGARVAWRNSSKCIGRISWNTLRVRDCRHVDSAKGIFAEVCKHLREATAGTNIQSVMTVFKPQEDSEPLGTRFWSSQLVRYAGYSDPVTGAVMGDSANVELTAYLIKHNYWTPPEPRTQFDVLPLVLKRPGRHKPDIFQLPEDVVHEVAIEHPTLPAISRLGYRWSTVPAISNFKMSLGGITYQNIPFNGWFLSTEIVRNLMERYGADVAIADVLGLDRKRDAVWRQQVGLELERAVLYSFKKGGYTIVDPMAVGKSFCTHVRREREHHARECPGQWSWIGGLVGPTNPTWHLEMRDFLVAPQYEYCVEGLALHTAYERDSNNDADTESVLSFETDYEAQQMQIPRPLILYGSETGNAEAIARRLHRDMRELRPVLRSLNDVAGLAIVKKQRFTHVLCICSTFGKGEAPMNARRFFKHEIPEMSDVKYAVLGLGSTMYPDFCRAGVVLDKKLGARNLVQMCPLVKSDEATGSDKITTDWMTLVRNLIITPMVERYLAVRAEAGEEAKVVHELQWVDGTQGTGEKSGNEPAGSLCLSNVELLQDSRRRSRSVRRIVFEAPSDYVTGDHISVHPLNSATRVNAFLRLFSRELRASLACIRESHSGASDEDIVNIALEQKFEITCVEGHEREPANVFFDMPARLGYILTSKLDLSLDSKSLKDILLLIKYQLDAMFETTGREFQDWFCQSNRQLEEMLKYCALVSGKLSKRCTAAIDEILATFPSTTLLLQHFAELLFSPLIDRNGVTVFEGPVLKLSEVLAVIPRLQQRYYSISSSGTMSPKEVTITVGVLRSKTSKGAVIDGVCSNYLAGLMPGTDRARVAVHTSFFRLPRNPSAPVMMVGAGTGLSPLMGFLEDRAWQKQGGAESGPCELFFGCRTMSDFIYQREIGGFIHDGVTSLHLALSRPEQGDKMYVQHRIAAFAERTCELLMRDDTHYYVCGDARMAEACFEACVNVLRRHARMSRVMAVQHLRRMRTEGRWQADVWGIVSDFEEAKKAIMKSRRASAKTWLSTFREEL